MTRQELDDERREAEGPPTAGAERRRRRHERIAPGLSIVASAACVVVAEGRAVALAFHPRLAPTPRVLLSARGALARRARAIATAAGVPEYDDEALGVTLGALAEGQVIPPALYDAVAAVLRAARPGL